MDIKVLNFPFGTGWKQDYENLRQDKSVFVFLQYWFPQAWDI